MDTSKMKRDELIQFLESAKKGDLPKGSTVYFKVDNQYYKNNLETPITLKEFKNEFRSGFDSLFELSSNSDELEQLEELGFNPDEFPRIARDVKNEANIINELLTKLDNE